MPSGLSRKSWVSTNFLGLLTKATATKDRKITIDRESEPIISLGQVAGVARSNGNDEQSGKTAEKDSAAAPPRHFVAESAPMRMKTELPENEAERVEALRRYQILDTPPEPAFDRIGETAANFFHVAMVGVSSEASGGQRPLRRELTNSDYEQS